VLEDCRENDSTASLLLLDLDNFKRVNDSHGHEVGDAILRFFVSELEGRIRPTDLAARLGGDEFVLVLRGIDPAQARSKAVELTEHFDRLTFDPEGLALPCGVSVGSAAIDPAAQSVEAILRDADLDMYEAKRDRQNG
jgi:two-component system cell cycle response regulator